MSRPLDSPAAKFYRAQNQVGSLKEQFNSFVESQRYRVAIAERNPKTGKNALRVVAVKDDLLPSDWPLIIGEIAHNLRSALDHLACQLAALRWPNDPTVFEKASFPIRLYGPRSTVRPTRRRPAWNDKGRVSGLFCQRHLTMLKNLQPYLRKNGNRLSPLWLLHELNNADKHRAIQVARKTAGGMSLIITGDMRGFDITDPKSTYRRVPLKHGAKVGEATITGSPDGVQMRFHLEPKVVFWGGCEAVKGLPVVTALSDMLKQVHDVIMEFAPEFPPLRN